MTTAWDGKPCVYRFYDANGVLLYVGVSSQVSVRWAQHKSTDSFWSSDVARAKIRTFPSVARALEAERVAVRDENPLYNWQGRGAMSGWTKGEFFGEVAKFIHRQCRSDVKLARMAEVYQQKFGASIATVGYAEVLSEVSA